MAAVGKYTTLNLSKTSHVDLSQVLYARTTFANVSVHRTRVQKLGICSGGVGSRFLPPVAAMETSKTTKQVNDLAKQGPRSSTDEVLTEDDGKLSGKSAHHMSTIGNSTNIVWHKCSVEKSDRQELLNQKGCVIWITGLSGSGKSTLACALGRALHARGKLTYILDGDNCRHGLNRDLSFKAEDRAENIRRIGEVAKLFADAGVICIASLISPFRKERDACRALLPEGDFIEAQKLLDELLDKTLEVVTDTAHNLEKDPELNDAGVQLFKQAPRGIVFDHVDELHGPKKKPRLVPGEELDEKSKKFKKQLQSVAVDGADIIASAKAAYQKTLAKVEAREAAAKAAAKKEEERVAELKNIRGERWLPSISRQMRVNAPRQR